MLPSTGRLTVVAAALVLVAGTASVAAAAGHFPRFGDHKVREGLPSDLSASLTATARQ